MASGPCPTRCVLCSARTCALMELKDDRYDFKFNEEIGYYDRTIFTHVAIWHRWPYCKHVPKMMGASGLLIGGILGAMNVRGGRRTVGRSRLVSAAQRGLFGGLMFGTVLFSASFLFHCILGNYPNTWSMPSSEEGNIYFRPREFSRYDYAEDGGHREDQQPPQQQ